MNTTYPINPKLAPFLKGVASLTRLNKGAQVHINARTCHVIDCINLSVRYDPMSGSTVISDGLNYLFSTKDILSFVKSIGINTIFEFHKYVFGTCSVETMQRGKVVYFARFREDYNMFESR
jgi:hypothetical protein